MQYFNPFTENAELYRFNSAYRDDLAGWNIGRPQQPVKYLVETGQLVGKILDVGCGSGLQTAYISKDNPDILGVDFSPEAIEQARETARRENSPAQFLVWDALKLSQLNLRFDTVLDSGMMHCLNQEQRHQYVEEMQKILKPRGKLFLIASQKSMPYSEIEERFSDWKMNYIYATRYDYTEYGIPAFLVCLEKK